MAQLVERLNKYGKTTLGKAVAIGITLVVILVCILIIRNTLFSGTAVTTEPQVSVEKTEKVAQTAESAASVTEEKAIDETETVSDSSFSEGFEVFSSEILKDPFQSLDAGSKEATETGQAEKEKEPISLSGITYEDGTMKAEVIYSESIQALEVGQSTGPYMLVSIEDNSAKFLYGDTPFTISVGQTYYP